MPRFGLAIQLEHTGALEALELAQASRHAGFHGMVAADVIQPWVPPHDPAGAAPHLWSVLGAVGGSVTGPIGAVITANFRHHPAVIAQASSTLATMYPNRHWLALSAGEALNDAVTGQAWPRPPERIEAMFEAADMIRRLFLNSAAGKDTRMAGAYATVEGMRLWTLPTTPPPLLVAAAGPLTARRAGRQVDGFITMGNSLDKAQRLLERFYQGVDESKRDPSKTLTVARLHVSWAPTEEQAVSAALKYWPQAAMRFNTSDLRSPFDVAQIAKLVRVEDFESKVLITTDVARVHELARAYVDIGFDQVYIHNVGGADHGWFKAARLLG